MATDADVFDHCRALFGIGDWTEDHPLPYWRWRQDQVSRHKRVRTSRKVTTDQLIATANFCKANGIDVRDVTWLYKHLTDGLRWDARRRQALSTAVLEDDIQAAIEHEMTNPESPWTDRLIRARGPHRQAVYDEWRKETSST